MSQSIAMALPGTPDATLESFDALYRSCRDDLHAYLAGMLRDRAAAEDVTALAFERALRRRHRYDPRRGSQRAWLFGIARNAALDELRRLRRHAPLLAEPPAAEAETTEDSDEVALRMASVRAAVSGLDPREQELVALKFAAGLTNAEIASVIGVSETNAGTLCHRVITKLRRACDENA